MKKKTFEATVNRGGGAAGAADRAGGKAGHARRAGYPSPPTLRSAAADSRRRRRRRRYKCGVCGQQAPSLSNMQQHHESKHPKLPWDPTKRARPPARPRARLAT